MSSTPKSPGPAEPQGERGAEPKTRKPDPYLERQARRAAAPPLKRQVRETVPFLERQAAREADKAQGTGRAADRKSDD